MARISSANRFVESATLQFPTKNRADRKDIGIIFRIKNINNCDEGRDEIYRTENQFIIRS